MVVAENRKGQKMKTTGSFTKILTTSSIVLAIGLMTAFTSTAAAQEKGATMLLQSKAAPAATAEAGVMSCSKCKDSVVTITERPTKTGAKANTYTVTRHECPGCKNTVALSGHGKAAVQTAGHTCSLSGKEGATCCAKN